MYWHEATKQYIYNSVPFTLGQIQYPGNWLESSTTQEREDIGLVEVVEVGERKNDKYYFNSEELVGAELRITSIPKDVEQVRPMKEAEIRSQGAAELSQIASPYDAYERESWAIQSEEAQAYLKDNTASTPLIDALAEGRGITKTDLVAKIMENNNAFRVATGAALGRQQKRLDALGAAKTLEEVMAI